MEHKIKIPEGCQVIVSRVGDMAVVEIAKEDPEFKENDIVYTEFYDVKMISIFECEHKESGGIKFKYTFSINSNHLSNDSIYAYDIIRLATDSEKQLLFDKLKEKCLMFDGENVVRWRAKNDRPYYFLKDTNRIGREIESIGIASSDRYNIGNYFPTRELAEAFQKQYIDLLNNFHKNL